MPVSHPSPHAATPACERLLVIADERLCRALEHALATRVAVARSAATVAEGGTLIAAWRPDAVVLDGELPDGTCFDVLRVINEAEPTPAVVVVSGRVGPGEGFRLAQMGVRALVFKPVEPVALARALDEALTSVPDLEPLARAAVGRVGVHEVVEKVRAAMVSEALARTDGNRRNAARLLDISRPLLQYILRKRE